MQLVKDQTIVRGWGIMTTLQVIVDEIPYTMLNVTCNSQHIYTWVAGLTVIPTNVSQRGNNHVAATWTTVLALYFVGRLHSFLNCSWLLNLYLSWPTSWPILPLNGNRNFGFAQNFEQIVKRLYLHPSSGDGEVNDQHSFVTVVYESHSLRLNLWPNPFFLC